jgi:ribosomal 50S subunit-recycling heat shock protein
MRIDKYLKVTRIIKRRTVAKDIVSAERIYVNDRLVKPSYQLKLNDIITICFGNKKVTVKVINLSEHASKETATSLYELIYARPISEVKFQGYIYQNLQLTENNVAYIKLSEDIMKEFDVDSSAAGNMINDLKFVNEILVWVFLSEDKKMGIIKANIRSRGPFINDVAAMYGGGGHKYASGVRLSNWHDADELIKSLDKALKEYNNK